MGEEEGMITVPEIIQIAWISGRLNKLLGLYERVLAKPNLNN